jgi:hypothetical protein
VSSSGKCLDTNVVVGLDKFVSTCRREVVLNKDQRVGENIISQNSAFNDKKSCKRSKRARGIQRLFIHNLEVPAP